VYCEFVLIVLAHAGGVLAMCQLMLVDDAFCQSQLSLLFTLLEREQVRACVWPCM
jgi:hypothetical protein